MAGVLEIITCHIKTKPVEKKINYRVENKKNSPTLDQFLNEFQEMKKKTKGKLNEKKNNLKAQNLSSEINERHFIPFRRDSTKKGGTKWMRKPK